MTTWPNGPTRLTFGHLPKISRPEIAEANHRRRVEAMVDGAAVRVAAATVAEGLGVLTWHVDTRRVVTADDLRTLQPASGFVITLSSTHLDALLIVDFVLVLAALDLCLAETPRARRRPLSPLERGLALGLAARLCWRSGGDAMDLETPASSHTWLTSVAERADHLSATTMTARLGECRGRVRVLLRAPRSHRPSVGRSISGPLSRTLWTCIVSAPSIRLRAAEVTDLELGSLVVGLDSNLPDRLLIEIAGRCLLDLSAAALGDDHVEVVRWRDQPCDGGRVVTERPRLDENNSGLGELPVEVHITMGRTTLSLGEIAALGAGSIVEVDRAVGTDVELTVGGRVIARGDLADVEGQLGVVVSWVARDDEAR